MTKQSRDVWVRRVPRWARSGLSRSELAAREGVRPETLGWWRWFLGSRDAAQRTALAKRETTFVEVEPIVVAPVQERIEVALANGRVVRVPSAFSDSVLCRVLAAAERT